MNVEEQNAYLLRLLNRLYFELGVYRVFVEFGKLAAGEQAVEKILNDARKSPELRKHVDSFCQAHEVSLRLSGGTDPDQALREFLSLLDSKEKPN